MHVFAFSCLNGSTRNVRGWRLLSIVAGDRCICRRFALLRACRLRPCKRVTRSINPLRAARAVNNVATAVSIRFIASVSIEWLVRFNSNDKKRIALEIFLGCSIWRWRLPTNISTVATATDYSCARTTRLNTLNWSHYHICHSSIFKKTKT